MIRYDRQLYVDFNKTHIKYVFNGTKLDTIALKTRVYIHCQKLNKLGWGKIMCEREHLQWKCYHKGLCEVVREVWLNSQVWDVWKKFAHLYFSRIGMRAHFYCMFAVLSWKFWSFRNKLHAFWWVFKVGVKGGSRISGSLCRSALAGISFGSSSGIGTKLVYMHIKSSRPPYFDILLYTIFNRLTLNLLICFMYLEKKDYFFQNYFLVLWMVRIKWCKPNLIGMPLLVLGGVVLGWALWWEIPVIKLLWFLLWVKATS